MKIKCEKCNKVIGYMNVKKELQFFSNIKIVAAKKEKIETRCRCGATMEIEMKK